MTDDIDRRRTVLANRKRLGYYIGTNPESNVGNQIGERPMTAAERSRKSRGQDPHRRIIPPAPFTPPPGAACLGTTDIFYDEEHATALAACRQCPTHWPCRYAALEVANINQYGVQGGLTADQRTAIRRQWTRVDTTVMRYRRAEALDQSWALRRGTVAA